MLASMGTVYSVTRAERERPTLAGVLGSDAFSSPLPRLIQETHSRVMDGEGGLVERLWAPPRQSSFRNRLMSSNTASGDNDTRAG